MSALLIGPVAFVCDCASDEISDIMDYMEGMAWPVSSTLFHLTDRATPTRSIVATDARKAFAGQPVVLCIDGIKKSAMCPMPWGSFFKLLTFVTWPWPHSRRAHTGALARRSEPRARLARTNLRVAAADQTKLTGPTSQPVDQHRRGLLLLFPSHIVQRR